MRPSLRPTIAAICFAIVCTGAAISARPVQDAEPEPPAAERFLGALTCVEVDVEQGTIEARAGARTVELTGASTARWFEHTAVKIGDLPGGTKIHVLGRRQESQRTPGGSSISPRIIQVSAVVAGDYAPPPVPPSLAEAKLGWITGPIGKVQGKELTLGGVLLGAGADRICIAIAPSTFVDATRAEEKVPPRLGKGTLIRASGRREAPAEPPARGKKPPPRIALEQGEILAKGFSPKEYAIILGTAE